MPEGKNKVRQTIKERLHSPGKAARRIREGRGPEVPYRIKPGPVKSARKPKDNPGKPRMDEARYDPRNIKPKQYKLGHMLEAGHRTNKQSPKKDVKSPSKRHQTKLERGIRRAVTKLGKHSELVKLARTGRLPHTYKKNVIGGRFLSRLGLGRNKV